MAVVGPQLIKVTAFSPPLSARLDFLDLIRGIAIIAVFLFHAHGKAFPHDQLSWGLWLRDFSVQKSLLLLLFPLTFGWAGVAIFFVVSGFCIHLSFAHQRNWTLFFQRRFFRIYLPYLAVLLFLALLFPLSRLNVASRSGAVQLGSHLVLLHNFDPRTFFGINASFWSIAVEVQLYACYPALLALIAWLGWKRVLVSIAAIEIALRVGDGALSTITGVELPHWLKASPFYYWFSWSVGAGIAEAHLRGYRISLPRFSLWAVGVLAVTSPFIKPLASLSFLLFAVLTAGVVVALLPHTDLKLRIPALCAEHLRRVGLWSFSIYLIHQPLLRYVPRIAAKILPNAYMHPLGTFALCIASWFLLLPIARLCYHFIELPSIALGKYLCTSK